MSDVAAPVYAPLGGTSVSGTALTVDMMAKNPEIIPQLIRDFTADNEGYFIEQIYATPGSIASGGVVIGTPTFPEDQFLDPDQTIAPRAPGAESPDIGALRREPQIFRPESWAGKIEITDEAVRHNKIDEVENLMRKASNTFADRVQTSGLNALRTAIATWSRTASSISWGDAAAASGGTVNVARTTQPNATFRQVQEQFINDKTGVRPDTLIVNPQEGTFLDEIYEDRLPAVLKRYGITNMFETPLQTAGKAWFAKSKQVGSIRWDKQLDQETQRGPAGTWKTITAMELCPIYVLLDAGSIFEVTGLAA